MDNFNVFSMKKQAPGTIGIIAVCAAIFLIQIVFQGMGSNIIVEVMALHPVFYASRFYQLLSYGFVHSGFLHFGFNMIVLLFVGSGIEAVIGTRKFLVFYLFLIVMCGIVTLVYFTISPWPLHTVLGSSGALCALLMIYWSLNPLASVLLFFIIPMPIRYFMFSIIAFDCVGTIIPIKTGLAHVTHLAGYACGAAFVKRQFFINTMSRLFRRGVHKESRERIIHGQFDKKRHYTETIDPILEKISREGIESLNRREQEILEKAGKKKE